MSPLAGVILTPGQWTHSLWPYIYFQLFCLAEKKKKKILGNGVEREMIGCGIRDETFVWILDGSGLGNTRRIAWPLAHLCRRRPSLALDGASNSVLALAETE